MSASSRPRDTAPLIRLSLVAAALAVTATAVSMWSLLRLRPSNATGVFGTTLATRAMELTDPAAAPPPDLVRASIDERDLYVRDGLDIELVYAVPRDQGSWVCLAVDQRGRLIAGDQHGGLFRVTPGVAAATTIVEPIDLPVGAAHGLLCVDSELYCVSAGNRADGPGLYRLRDSDGDDVFDEWRRLRAIRSGDEHGPHGITLGPDGLLYIVAGNHTPLPGPERSVVPRVWGEDLLLPRLWDARGHAAGIMAPGGWICRTDREGETWEVFAVGFRNPYDLAFDELGELFTYDADMEWDMGAPWYRPTRINHVVSGAEFGWRSGTGKWPEHWPDSLPATLDLGPGSPTGVCFGYDTGFPERYRRALFAADWTFGTIYAVHLVPDGATYRATHEPFVTGRPLPVADVVANPVDGALYFVIGGRGVESAVYRVVAADPADTAKRFRAVAVSPRLARRRALEKHHTPGVSSEVIDHIWPHLGSDDRFTAFAARVALEHQPIDWWRSRALAEPDPRKATAALIALTRHGDASDHDAVIDALEAIDPDRLEPGERHAWLRAWSLCFVRLGRPDDRVTRRLATRLGGMFPTGDDRLDRALCDLLVYLRSPTVVASTLPLMERADDDVETVDFDLVSRNDRYGSAIIKMAAAMPQRAQVHYALSLSNAEAGWTPTLRQRYFQWFDTAREARGGLSFSGFLDDIRRHALDNVPEPQRGRYEQVGVTPAATLADLPQPAGPGRAWTVEDVMALVADETTADFESGRVMYAAAMCGRCHRFAGTGLPGGPDLTQVATRYTTRDLVEALVEPGRTISDQYQQTEFLLDDDAIIIGRVVRRDADRVEVMPSMLSPDHTVTLDRRRIVREMPSSRSPMMPALLNRLNADEVRNLIAYLRAEGDARHPLFTPER